ncbi:hypothetical protein QJS10_CPA01g02377 [Acorus calamus]|uniref:Uncharacterized protein n=1 Tax=Acorus calamus TaxID=4465 RepID=A0AAV9FLQ6_ACOCL|nr:hypothetical protein QJS10_CPA01g02377 [Acorus calamus]
MRGITKLPVKNILKQMYPAEGATRMTAILTPRKHDDGEFKDEHVLLMNGKVEPIVAFSRPPPLPPFIGPLVALSLLEMGLSGDDE